MLPRLLLLTPLLLSACASQLQTSPSGDELLERQLVGSWDCTLEISTPEAEMLLESTDSFVANERYTSIGGISLFIPEFGEELYFHLSDVGTWEVIDGNFVAVSENIQVKLVSHPEMSDYFDLEDFFPEGASAAASIIELNEQILVTRIRNDIPDQTCVRVGP